MITLNEVKEECGKNIKCETCIFHPKYFHLAMNCIIMEGDPSRWDLDMIEKILRRKNAGCN